MVQGASRLITGHPVWVIGGAVLFGAIFWVRLPQVVLRPDVDDFLAVKDPSFIFRKELRALFPNNEFAVIATQSEDLFTPANLRMIQGITETLEEKETVKSVKSLANVNDMVGGEDDFSVSRFLNEIPESPAALSDLRKRAVENPLYLERLISRDGRTAAIVVFTRTDDVNPTYREDFMRDIQSVLAPYEAQGHSFHLAGWPVTNYYLARFMNRDLVRFAPITFFLVTITIWLVFRNIRLLLLAGVGIGATVGATVGLLAVLGISLNNASVAVIPIVIALALSDIVHVFSHLTSDVLREYPDRRAALSHVLEQILFPCSLTSLNTAIGFFSLSFSGIPAVQAFGWLAGAGMVFEFVFTFGIVTPLLLAFRPETLYREATAHQNRVIPRLIRGVHGFVFGHARWVLVFCLAAMAWGAWECRRLKAETNLIQFFQPTARVRQDVDFVINNLAGVMPLDIFLEGETEVFREPATLEYLDRLKKRVLAVPGVDTATSLADYFKEMNKSFHNEDPAFYRPPATRRMADQYLLLYSATDLEDFVTPDYRRSRMMVRLHSSSSKVNEGVLNDIQKGIEEETLPGLRVRIGGDAPVHVSTPRAIVGGQVQNVFSAVFTIWLVMAVVLRSLGMAGVFLLPNLFPILINFGVMGAFGIPLDTGTSLIAAAAFGVIVDDTVHFFTRFQELRAKGQAYFEVLQNVSFEKGEASTSSFLVMCAGFGVLTLSGFRPIMYFGILNVLVLMVGFVGDQFLLKSLLVLWGKRKGAIPLSEGMG